tara:strand:- start:2589 stop:3476 length:888 start_codon:yes stop_codon:yes gene_type:complete
MKQYNLSDLEAFVAIVEKGSFHQAASAIHTSTAGVSRRLSALENALGLKLMRRTTRQLNLTEAGEQFYHDACQVLAALEEAEQRVQQQQDIVKGHLKLAAPLSFGLEKVSPLIPEFMRQHPALNVHLEFSDAPNDLVAEKIDLSLRIGELKDSTLVATRLADVQRWYCAAPAFLDEYGIPTSLDELRRLPQLRYTLLTSTSNTVWDNVRQGDANIRMSSNNGAALCDAAIGGLGIVLLPDFITQAALDSGRLIRVLESETPEPLGLYAVRPTRQFTPLKVRLLLEFLRERLGEGG